MYPPRAAGLNSHCFVHSLRLLMNPEARDDLKMFRASGAFTRLCLCVQASRLRLVPEFRLKSYPARFNGLTS
jgi:hypothetical protein